MDAERLAAAYAYLERHDEAVEAYTIHLGELLHPASRTPERICALGRYQQLAGEIDAALSNFHSCLKGLEPGAQWVRVQNWIAELGKERD